MKLHTELFVERLFERSVCLKTSKPYPKIMINEQKPENMFPWQFCFDHYCNSNLTKHCFGHDKKHASIVLWVMWYVDTGWSESNAHKLNLTKLFSKHHGISSPHFRTPIWVFWTLYVAGFGPSVQEIFFRHTSQLNKAVFRYTSVSSVHGLSNLDLEIFSLLT